jgi:hypothetical protein
MRKRYTPEQQAERVREIHEGRVSMDVSTYAGLRVRCRFIDVDYGEWYTTPFSAITMKRGHPKRGYRKMAEGQTITRTEMEARLQRVHGDKISLGPDFVGVYTKCTFIDPTYGSWRASPQHVLDGNSHHPRRRKELVVAACLKKYGVRNPMHDPVVMEKVAGKTRRGVLQHWKTGVYLSYASGYEKAFIEWCNYNQYDFEWQIKHDMPDGRVYYIDAHVLSGPLADLWVEIKGYMREHSRLKWEWFHNLHPNSELWARDVLRQRGITTRSQ